MALIYVETADTDDYTQIGEGLTRVARQTGRLATGHDVGKYALRHDDGCADCGRETSAGEGFYLDAESGEMYCATHGEARRSGENNSAPS